MSIDKSLRRKNQLARARNVLTRAERIRVLQDDERSEAPRNCRNKQCADLEDASAS